MQLRILPLAGALMAIALHISSAHGQAQQMNRTEKRCYPNFDPITGAPYPACPHQNMTRHDREMIDITADSYKRVLDSAKREGIISEGDFRKGMDRVREARTDARSRGK